MDILPIQGSAVPCERVFSSAKETMTARRNHINTELMEALQMLKYSFNRGRSLNFTEGTGKKDELELMERLMSQQEAVPTDIEAFISSIFTREEEEDDDDDNMYT
jgi:hypothetical protein